MIGFSTLLESHKGGNLVFCLMLKYVWWATGFWLQLSKGLWSLVRNDSLHFWAAHTPASESWAESNEVRPSYKKVHKKRLVRLPEIVQFCLGRAKETKCSHSLLSFNESKMHAHTLSFSLPISLSKAFHLIMSTLQSATTWLMLHFHEGNFNSTSSALSAHPIMRLSQ